MAAGRTRVTIEVFAAGGYRYIPGVFQYSGGVAAEPGYAIERVTFRRALPLQSGFERAAAIIKERGRPLTAFCACELRSPAQFTDQGFRDFNTHYVKTLEAWGIYDSPSRTNPVARSNVCPEIGAPSTPSFHAFSFTVPAKNAHGTFVVAGSGEAREGGPTYRERTVRYGERSPDALREKACFVLDEMQRRQERLGFTWGDTTASQVYTVHDLFPFLSDEIVRRGAARHGLTWHFARPPVQGLEYEMDCRGVAIEHFAE
jgi:hypothetical protein